MQQQDKKRAPRHYYSKDSPEMKNIFAVTGKGLDFNRDYTMMNPGKLTKFVQILTRMIALSLLDLSVKFCTALNGERSVWFRIAIPFKNLQ